MENYYVISDIHGRLDLLQSALRDWKQDKEQLILLGDYIDYGPYSKQTLHEVKFLAEKYGAVALKGNHEAVVNQLITAPNQPAGDGRHWLDSGRKEMFESFLDAPVGDQSLEFVANQLKQKHPHLLGFMSDLPMYFETERFIFVHAGIDTLESDWRLSKPETFLWTRTPFIQGINTTGKVIVFGHSRTGWIRASNEGKPMSALFAMAMLDDRVWLSPCESKLGIDGGSVFGGVLHGVHLSDKHPDTVITTVSQDGDRHKALLSLESGLSLP